MHRIIARAKEELEAVAPPAVFFFLTFHILAFTRRLMLMEYGISVSTFMAATIGALVVAKVILVVDLVPWVNRYPDKPLIYNVAWKTAIYLVASLVVHYVEHLIPFVHQHENLATATRHLFAETIWPHFWAVQMWLLLLLFVYCALRELIRALGRERVLSMFFGTSRRTTAG
jgi:hypothetical protein